MVSIDFAQHMVATTFKLQKKKNKTKNPTISAKHNKTKYNKMRCACINLVSCNFAIIVYYFQEIFG